MKKMTGISRYISMPVFSVIFVVVLLLDAAFYNSIRTDMEANYREIGNARLTWVQQSLERYVTITSVVEGRVKEPGGPHVPDQAKLADFVKMDNALRSVQIIQYSGHMSSLFFEEIYCFFLKKCNLNTPPGKSIFSNIFRRSIFLFQRYHYFVIGIQLMFIQ